MSVETNNWEELRRQARQLENEIDLKLVSFSKLGTSYGSPEFRNENSDTVPLLSSTNSDHMFETMALEIEQLLSKVRLYSFRCAYKSSSGLNRRTDLYLKEHEHLRNSEKMVDDQISIAVKTKEELLNQRLAMKAIQTKMTTLVNRFPIINSLIQRINLRKRRDSIILALVISACLVLFLMYSFH
ncbi:golgi SNAP receptor complex member 1 [Trichonephila inaurata madagascariensis]|uniref:Golgi SNAP receptor complex member 1 n=1 Tax=Trichonephila inaurata madagascariensis TaxID=2747483 RepID=A0A8X6Y1D6_9ARAC|nr:golgi SNAP receptor complex member 1 [Trichonephila inaurata madagascariensis]